MDNNFFDLIIDKEFERYDSLPMPELSIRAKKNSNRMFREVIGSSKIPYPEIDNRYELIRSKIIRFFKVIIFKITNINKK